MSDKSEQRVIPPPQRGVTEYRYAVFRFNEYYPSGGWSDCKDSYADIDQAIKEAMTHRDISDRGSGTVYTQVVDFSGGGVVVAEFSFDDGELSSADIQASGTKAYEALQNAFGGE